MRTLVLLATLTILGALLVPHHVSALRVPTLAILVATALDLGAEWRACAVYGPLAAAGRLHQIYAVDPALQTLAAAGIPVVPRALAFRTLFHFFAPYAPIEFLVPAERAAEAETLLRPLLAP